jgi:hypothetical protein
MKSNTLKNEPSLVIPYTLTVDPNLAYDLREREDPKWTKSNIDTLLAIRARPYKLHEEPILPKERILVAEPICA